MFGIRIITGRFKAARHMSKYGHWSDLIWNMNWFKNMYKLLLCKRACKNWKIKSSSKNLILTDTDEFSQKWAN